MVGRSCARKQGRHTRHGTADAPALALRQRLRKHGRSVAVFSSILDAIGHTPLVRLSRIGRTLQVELYGKVEACNPGGSAKDRLALHLCDMAEKRGLLRPGGT